MSFGTQFKRIRKEKNISQIIMAEKLGVTQGVISAYENDKTKPSVDVLMKIVEALGCTANDLLMQDQQQ